MTRKGIILLITLALCFFCLFTVSADTGVSGSNTANPVFTGTDHPAASGSIPALRAQIGEETTTEPTYEPVTYPTEEPTEQPTLMPTTEETGRPTEPTLMPTEESERTTEPTLLPTNEETGQTTEPTLMPTEEETTAPVPGQLAPVADFSASPASGSGPLTVRFTDTSLNSPTMWYWDFGDGSTDSSTGNPSHTFTDPGSYTVTLTATNMYGTDTISKSDYITVNGEIMKNGAIYAQSSPGGATIFVNGASYGTSPVTVPDLLPGTYSVMATLNGYYADLRTITVTPGRTAGYYPNLRNSPNPPVVLGAISVQSAPSGADIFVNGVYYGRTPFTIQNIAPGTYSILASLNGYSSNTQLVVVNPGQTSSYYPTLQPSPSPGGIGAIFVQSDPDGAAVFLNGNYYGVSPITIPNLDPGTYSMKATLSGYPDDTRRITVSAGRTVFYNPVFYPSPPPIGSGQGIIAVYSNAEGASVFFDNTNEGKITNGVLYVPVAITGTPFQNFRVESPGYTTLTGPITPWPGAGEIVKIQANLVPSPVTTTRAPLPLSVTLGALIGAGIVLIARNRRSD